MPLMEARGPDRHCCSQERVSKSAGELQKSLFLGIKMHSCGRTPGASRYGTSALPRSNNPPAGEIESKAYQPNRRSTRKALKERAAAENRRTKVFPAATLRSPATATPHRPR